MREYHILQRSRLLTGAWSMCKPVGAGADTTDRSWWNRMCGLHLWCIQRGPTVAKNESLVTDDVDGNALWRRTFWPTQGLVEPRFHRAECVLWGFGQRASRVVGLRVAIVHLKRRRQVPFVRHGCMAYALRDKSIKRCTEYRVPTIVIALYQGRSQNLMSSNKRYSVYTFLNAGLHLPPSLTQMKPRPISGRHVLDRTRRPRRANDQAGLERLHPNLWLASVRVSFVAFLIVQSRSLHPTGRSPQKQHGQPRVQRSASKCSGEGLARN